MSRFQNRSRFYVVRRGTYQPDFVRYEQLKARWVADHPEATPEQYQQAIRQIAAECRI
jgi:hypothetical protein